MSTQTLLLPVFAHVLLVFALLALTGSRRRAALIRGEVKMKDIALDNAGWPEPLRKLANSYDNQFQLPVLFYGVMAFYLVTGLADSRAVVLAWAFVATRYMHSWIHATTNYVPHRFLAFSAGVVMLLGLWVWLFVRLYVTG
jgi:hypothetical protein